MEKINTKIVFATIIELTNEKIEKEEMEKIVLVQIPSQIYGELRKYLLVYLKALFKDIKISKEVDFHKLYASRNIQ